MIYLTFNYVHVSVCLYTVHGCVWVSVETQRRALSLVTKVITGFEPLPMYAVTWIPHWKIQAAFNISLVASASETHTFTFRSGYHRLSTIILLGRQSLEKPPASIHFFFQEDYFYHMPLSLKLPSLFSDPGTNFTITCIHCFTLSECFLSCEF